MNKKFSTLMAGLMLASAFSVSAQTTNAPTEVAAKYETGKFYMLGDASNILTVVSSASDEDYAYGELKMVPRTNGGSDWTLQQTREALWQVTVTAGQAGNAPKYSFVNVATGMTLSVSVPTKNYDDDNAKGVVGYGADKLMISGGYMEWLNGLANSYTTTINGDDFFISYVNNTDVVYLMYDATNGLYAKRNPYTKMDASALKISPWKAKTVELTAEDLNKELIMNNDEEGSFTLSFDRDVTEGAKNLFAGVELVAEKLYYTGTDGADAELLTKAQKEAKNAQEEAAGNQPTQYDESKYVRVHVKDTKNYLVVDTVLHAGSEADRQLPQFNYADPNAEIDPLDANNVARMSRSFNFKFAYEPLNDRLLIKVQAYATQVKGSKGQPATIVGGGVDGKDVYTYWPTENYSLDGVTGQTPNIVKDAYVRLVELSNVRELTVASGKADGTGHVAGIVNPDATGTDTKLDEWENPNHLTYGMLTTVKIGEGLMVYKPTTIDTGLYLIQFVKNSANEDADEGNYYIANLGGAFGYAEQARNQNYDHMPAAQWYVVRDGQNSASEFTLINREFFDKTDVDGVESFGENIQYRAFSADEKDPYVVFFRNGAFANDTVKFIPVTDESKKDAKLGYKYVDEKTSTVETYVFDYLHGLAAANEVGLNTPIAKDSLVRVDQTGEKIAFRLVPVAVDDNYGMQTDASKTGIANLVRNAYYIKVYDEIKFAEDNRDRYLTYDTKSKKYVMSTTPTPYFLKENNCVENGAHYYALVEANLFQVYENEFVDKVAKDKVVFYPAELAGKALDDDAVKAYKKAYQEADGTEDKPYYLVTFYDENGKFIIVDASKDIPLYAYQEDADSKTITLQRVVNKEAEKWVYYYMNPTGTVNKNVENTWINWYYDSGKVGEDIRYNYLTQAYASSRVSVDDNTLDLTNAVLEDKFTYSEIRVSAFAVTPNDAPLYRRFNGVAPETFGTAADAPVNLKFFRVNNNAEYLFENQSKDNEYRDGLKDNSISFLGVNNAFQFPENETRSYTMYVDTAYVRNNTRMPQYLIGVRPEVVEGDTILCDASTHQHATEAEALACEHSIIRPYFVRAMYLFNAQDSIDAKNYDYQGKAAYGASDYTRLAFKDAVHANDTLYILKPGVTTEQIIEANFKNADLFSNKIALDNNKHKNVVFQFRLLDEQDNRFLIESEAEQNGAAVLNKDLKNVSIAPSVGGWLKIQNGVPVIARNMTFNEASAQADVFDVNDEITYDATANDEVAVESVKVIAGDGQVTIMGAAGKNVTITTVLGKTVVAKTIASDNETIAVPTTGIVAVAVEGEEAIMTIVK